MNNWQKFRVTGLGIAVLWGSPAIMESERAITQITSSIEQQAEELFLQGVQQFYDGDFRNALTSWKQSLDLYQQVDSRMDEANSLAGIGHAHNSLGQYHQAITAYKQWLDISIEIDDQRGKAFALGHLGNTYWHLGEYQQAIIFNQQSFEISRVIGHQRAEARSLSNLGLAYASLKNYQEGITFNQQSLEIARKIGEERQEAHALSNLGVIYERLKEYQQAIIFNQQALTIARNTKYIWQEAKSLNNLGLVHQSLKEYQQAISLYEQSIVIKEVIGDSSGLALTFANLGRLFRDQKQPALAITFLKESMRIRESIRIGIAALDSSLQHSYLKTIEDDYRLLAKLLLEQNRILEAQRVLDLLKIQELDDLFSDDIRSPKTEQYGEHDYHDLEKDFLVLYDKRIATALDIGKNIYVIEDIPRQDRTPEQRKILITLREKEATFLASFDDFLNSEPVQNIVQELQQNFDNNEAFHLFQAEELRGNLQNLREVGEHTAILYPLILEDRLELVLVSADAVPLRHTVNISRADLNAKVSNALSTLRDRNNDYSALIDLHKTLITPLEPTLEAIGIETLIYAPDGALRYIPLAALTDGNQWLIEKYRLNNITALSLTDFDEPRPNQELSVLAAAYTDEGRDVEVDLGFHPPRPPIQFRGLSYTATEIDQISLTIPDTEQYRDDQFTKRLIREMNDFSVVHFATHGYFIPARPRDSFLLFGNGEHSTIDDMKNWNTLTNVDLVVLSACETGVGDDLGSGVEILGLGYRLQQKGAQAVMSSLWQVQDNSTQSLMAEFYTYLQAGETKAEALRLAQQSLSQNEEFSHPYHWASFILIGNGL